MKQSEFVNEWALSTGMPATIKAKALEVFAYLEDPNSSVMRVILPILIAASKDLEVQVSISDNAIFTAQIRHKVRLGTVNPSIQPGIRQSVRMLPPPITPPITPPPGGGGFPGGSGAGGGPV